MLSGELISRAAEFVGDARLPPGEALALRLALIGLLREEGQRLAQVVGGGGATCGLQVVVSTRVLPVVGAARKRAHNGSGWPLAHERRHRCPLASLPPCLPAPQAGSAAAAAPLLSAAYDALSGVELEGEEGEEGGLAAEVQAIGGQVMGRLHRAACLPAGGSLSRMLDAGRQMQHAALTTALPELSRKGAWERALCGPAWMPLVPLNKRMPAAAGADATGLVQRRGR